MKLDRIVVGVDFSPASRDALARALTLAPSGATIVLVHSVEASLVALSTDLAEGQVAETRAKLTAAARAELETWGASAKSRGFAVEAVVAEGRPADEVLAAAATGNFVVVGTHDRSALGHLMLGSIAEEIAVRGPVPTLVVRPQADAVGKVERVLLALDPGAPSRETIDAAAAVAARLHAALEVVHVVRLPTASYVLGALGGGVARDRVGKHVAATKEALGKLVRDVTGLEVPVHVVTGRPADEILKMATGRDVIACATHGRAGIGRLVVGSVAARLIRYAPCSVLVTRFV